MENNKEHKLPVGKKDDGGQESRREYTMEELKNICDNLANDNMNMRSQIRKQEAALDEARQMIDSLQTQNLFAYLNSLNKVLDNAALFNEGFIDNVTASIEDIMGKLHELFLGNGESGDNENAQAE